MTELQGKPVAVVVLGDIGRSPRMQYHSLSLASHGAEVSIIGYPGSSPMDEILATDDISIRHLHEWKFRPKSRLLFLALLPFRVLYESLALFITLFCLIRTPEIILVQNPPSIPSLIICKLASLFTGSVLIIDWHNFGYTILGLRLGRSHIYVQIAYWYERISGRMADQNLCVTTAMQNELKTVWQINAVVLHDRAPERFRRLTLPEIHSFYLSIQKSGMLKGMSDWLPEDASKTLLTQQLPDGSIKYLSDRPVLIISSTSYSPDEDFQMLLDCLAAYDKEASDTAPKLAVVITGKGPLKEYFAQAMSRLRLTRVRIIQVWLRAEDYPRILGCSDLGISLHTSSSGLDLPMKVVDMFGSGLPVCAVNFNCLNELLVHKKNGLVFSTSTELKEQLQDLLSEFPVCKQLSTMQKGVAEFASVRWDESWDKNALPCFKQTSKPFRTMFSMAIFILACLIFVSYILH
uniref:Glycosyl transferase family 1 domain-containing protein n=1 Tax=Spongospora subterranea TaxID=70186 RepID=A0A0H5RAM8_9EUKA|eukprot:CRZ10707.1 hypothetical protein [Spongospora subterranea]